MGVCWSNESAERAAQQSAPASQGLVSWRPQWQSREPMIKEQIIRRREEFWDTAPSYEGRREIWDALRAACEAETRDLAAIIIESAGIRLPDGTLSRAFDELGALYQVPEYCISFPTNMVQADTKPSTTAGPQAAVKRPEEPKEDLEKLQSVQVRVRLSTGHTFPFTARTVKELFAQIEEKTGVPPAYQRAYYCGDEVRGPLSKFSFTATDILQVFLFQRTTKQL